MQNPLLWEEEEGSQLSGGESVGIGVLDLLADGCCVKESKLLGEFWYVKLWNIALGKSLSPS